MIAPLSASTVVLLVFLILSCFCWISGTVNVGAVLFFTTLTCISATFDDQRAKKKAQLALTDLQTMDPRELELHVARVLGGLPGWKAEATRSSADQGADVIATGPNRQRLARGLSELPQAFRPRKVPRRMDLTNHQPVACQPS